MQPTVEIAVQDVADARVAIERGADRVELCCALDLGGLTPSIGAIEACVGAGVPVAPLIRPRGGDFEYSADDVAVCERDVVAAVRAGAGAVVVGALRDGRPDVAALRRWSEAARAVRADVDVVVHRCVDVALGAMSPEELIDQLAGVGGITRILTSGGAARCGQGLDVLAELAGAGGGIEVQAGGGLRVEDVAPLAAAGVRAFHLSASRAITGGAVGPGGGASERRTVDPDLVSQYVAAARAAVGATCGRAGRHG